MQANLELAKLVRLIVILAATGVSCAGQATNAGVLLLSEDGLRHRAQVKLVPSYPSGALKHAAHGVVVATITINTEGIVSEVEVLQSPEILFNYSVVTAMKKWKFALPTGPKGERIGAKGKVTFYFRFDKGRGWVDEPRVFKTNKKA